MTPWATTAHARIFAGDCREVLASLPDASVDSVVTDPPYELGFMGKAWDAQGVAYDVDLWREVLRVLKPGGHLLAFGGTRTYHRLACAVEDAGFEVRDSIHWVYGSGFPKSLDVSKAIDKQRDDRAEVYEVTAWVREQRDAAGVTNAEIDAAFGANGMGRHWTDVPPNGKQPAVPTLEQVPTLLDVLGVDLDAVPERIRHLLWDLNGRKGQPGENWWKREITGTVDEWQDRTNFALTSADGFRRDAAATPEAARWEGWGTALKPAHEPVVVARKPLAGTVAQTVLAHGTGALNVDGCRVGTDGGTRLSVDEVDRVLFAPGTGALTRGYGAAVDGLGRWPSNLVLTHAADCGDGCAPGCPVAEMDRQSGDGVSRRSSGRNGSDAAGATFGLNRTADLERGHDDQGGASRFFPVSSWDPVADAVPFRYTAKPGRAERNAGLDGLPAVFAPTMNDGIGGKPHNAETATPKQNFHPTVKPVELMRWLVRLVTPPGGTVLEPFAGSGTTLAAAILEGFDVVGVELTEDYLPIVAARVAWAEDEVRFGPVAGPVKVRKDSGAPTLFDEDGAA